MERYYCVPPVVAVRPGYAVFRFHRNDATVFYPDALLLAAYLFAWRRYIGCVSTSDSWELVTDIGEEW